MRPCFAPTASWTFYKNLKNTILARKNAFEFVIKLEQGPYFTASFFPLQENRMLIAVKSALLIVLQL